jgi:hypothetical protein
MCSRPTVPFRQRFELRVAHRCWIRVSIRLAVIRTPGSSQEGCPRAVPHLRLRQFYAAFKPVSPALSGTPPVPASLVRRYYVAAV